jgi:glycosyltransferase involved in cell wall biosynthesis
VIIPVYNGETTIARCLDSLLAQTYPPTLYNIIVVENGSTDRTADVVAAYGSRVRLLRSPERGPAAARNLGIAGSQSDIIAFTDADCIADSNWLAELVSPYDDPEVGGVGGKIEAHRHPNRNPVEKFSDEHSPLINFESGEGEFLPHLYTANASYRRALLEQAGTFNSRMATGEDVELSWRVQLKTRARLSYNEKAVIYHHHRSDLRKLAKQYRQYGFGEILLDTLFRQCPGYPRGLGFQVKRIWGQCRALPRYLLSIGIRYLRLRRGLLSPDEAMKPRFLLLIEANNILGKLEALLATRLMRTTRRVFGQDIETYIERFY